MSEIKSNTSVACYIFDESTNKYDPFDVKALFLKSTYVDLVTDRNTIKKDNPYDKAPSQLGRKVPTPTLDLKCNNELSDCLSKFSLTPISKS